MAGPKERLNNFLRMRDATGKFSKGQAYYIGDAIQKPMRCGNCFHFQEGGGCRLVTSEGEPTPGRISPQGACSLYNARSARIQALQLAWGRGMVDGLAPEVARATAFMFTYAALDEEPPEDLVEKAVISPDTARAFFPRK